MDEKAQAVLSELVAKHGVPATITMFKDWEHLDEGAKTAYGAYVESRFNNQIYRKMVVLWKVDVWHPDAIQNVVETGYIALMRFLNEVANGNHR